jgi:hypothetical protein
MVIVSKPAIIINIINNWLLCVIPNLFSADDFV